MSNAEQAGWTSERSAELYNLDGWGQPYFDVTPRGDLIVRPSGDDGPAVELRDVIAAARAEGSSLPLLLRFDGILRHRVDALYGAFQAARREGGYEGRYRPVYPIKVNQQRHVVEKLLEAGRHVGLGLEVGSKPELMAVVALLDRPSLMICNGYKDETYLEMACLATRLGHEVVIVIEKPSEVETVRRVVEREGREAAPWLGIRARMAVRGAGRWERSSGDGAKFGLAAGEIVDAIRRLEEVGLLDRLRLLHFHIGSQIGGIQPVKAALKEAGRLYVEMVKLGCPMNVFDVGGGLAVDYEGSRGAGGSSRSYSEQEYANDVVWHIKAACDKAGLPVPDIVTESGRALVAHHAMLAVDVVGASSLSRAGMVGRASDDEHELVTQMRDNVEHLSRRTMLEVYHDAVALRDEMLTRFGLGLVDLETRAHCESLFYATLDHVARLSRTFDFIPDELTSLRSILADTYFCNFSVFQSVPDHWAIRQVFPVLPIQRLNERPTVSAVLGDMTCDSDGRMDLFQERGTHGVLSVHPLRRDEPYVIGVFLVGAYQEILGDLHNLFGDTDAVHVEVDPDGTISIDHSITGECVAEVLEYVQYDEAWLVERYEALLARLVESGGLTEDESAEVRTDLFAYLRSMTYLTHRSVKVARADDLATERLQDEAIGESRS